MSWYDENEDRIEQERMEMTIPKDGACRHPDCQNIEYDRMIKAGEKNKADAMVILNRRVSCLRENNKPCL